ncbi:MAG TPA: Crp/Fnr family transcriptional regulator [Candidatus Latescibacteria bacterium]|nr:Crp/Fnr family transcriptional regulator [Candidatus Latescibacterota bacterium]
MDAPGSYLRNVPFFAGLSESELAQIGTLVTQRVYPPENLIILAEDEGEALFTILSGQVKVSILNEDGKEVILAVLGQGDFFGEMSLLDGKPRSANVIATEETTVLILRRRDFLRLVERSPHMAIKVVAALTARLRKADRKIESLALMDVSGRVASVILQIAEERGVSSQRGICIHNPPNQQAIANMAGTSRETVSRVMKRLKERGYVAMRGKDILITREADLRADYSL